MNKPIVFALLAAAMTACGVLTREDGFRVIKARAAAMEKAAAKAAETAKSAHTAKIIHTA